MRSMIYACYRFFGILLKFIMVNCVALYKLLVNSCNYFDCGNVSRIVFTHNLGGGTESFLRRNYFDDETIIVRLISYRWDGVFQVVCGTKQKVLSYSKLLKIIKSYEYNSVVVNSFVAYSNMVLFHDLVLNIINKKELIYMVHDYHCTCRYSNNTFVRHNQYCNQECNNCFVGARNQRTWIKYWGEFLLKMDKIICFSESSKSIIVSFYPKVIKKIWVIPHSLDYFKVGTTFNPKGSNIGIIGNCSNYAKGKGVILKLVRELNKVKKEKLIIIGKSPSIFIHNSEYIDVYGGYKNSDLIDIIIKKKIGIIVFTSIWPETFSYAISEIIKIGLPVIALNIGAQGEKLLNYKNTIFVNDLSPSTILHEVRKYFQVQFKENKI